MHALSEVIQQTVRDFRSDCSAWEGEVLELFDDLDRFLGTARRNETGSNAVIAAQDIAGLRGLVEQQTEVLTALVNALTGQSAAVDAEREANAHTSRPAAPEIDPFERLQLAVAAASAAS